MFTRVHDVEQMFGALNLFRHGMGDFFLNRPSRSDRSQRTVTDKLLTNVFDNGDALVVQVEVPGLAKDDLDIQLQGKHLLIKGERHYEAPEGYTVHRQDLGQCSFSRAYTLPIEIAADRVSSSLDDGILTLTLPKAEEAKPRKITIQ
jgi:HSP20 family protein